MRRNRQVAYKGSEFRYNFGKWATANEPLASGFADLNIGSRTHGHPARPTPMAFDSPAFYRLIARENEPLENLVYTSMPSIDLGSTLLTEPDGWTECFIPMAIKQLILYTSGFPAPIDRPPSSYCVRESPIAGQGLFATRPLKAGELILVERAMMITPRKLNAPGVNYLQDGALLQATLASIEADLEILFSRMPPQNQEAFMALTTAFKQDESGPILGRLRTNRYGLEVENDNVSMCGVFNYCSRLNHSCGPNVGRHFDMKTFAMKLYAVRDIEEGEELTTDYCGIIELATRRQDVLRSGYSFTCSCPCCQDPESDARRLVITREVSRLSGDWPSRIRAWMNDPSLPDDHLSKGVEHLLALIEREGLEVCDQYIMVLIQMCGICNALGKDHSERFLMYKGRLLCAWIIRGLALEDLGLVAQYRIDPFKDGREHAARLNLKENVE